MLSKSADKFLNSLEQGKAKYFAGAKNNGQFFLDRSQKLLTILDRPDAKIPHLLHVAGTSGKGSVCNYLSAIFTAAGYKTGLTVSPHLSDLTERWQINGQPISTKKLNTLLLKLKKAIKTYTKLYPGECPSYFEATAALAFMYFAEEKVDWAIIEVGMGGKYDATNAMLKKDAAIITDLGLDHTATLGKTIPKITAQKAGIITSSPVFTSTNDVAALKVIKKTAAQQKAQLFCPITTKNLKIKNITARGTTFTFKARPYFVAAPGLHQARNAALAISVAEYFNIKNKQIVSGLKKANQPARLELIGHKPTIFLDGAHNEQKMWSTISTYQKYLAKSETHLVVGFLADKNCHAMVKALAALKPKTIACTAPTETGFRETLVPKALVALFKKYCPEATITALAPKAALAWSLGQAKPQDTILVTGSLYLAGELRPFLINRV